MTEDTTTPTPNRPPIRRRTRAGWIAASVLVAGLALAGCSAVAAEPAATTSASASADTSTADAEVSATTDGEGATTTAETIADTTAAAEAFLATLTDAQRETVLYAFDDETKTTSWTNFPVTFVERAGLNLDDLTEEQRTAAMAVLEALLDDEAYAMVTGIIGGDEYLGEYSSSSEDSLGQYYIAFFGDPSDTASWEVQFGGHHLGINATLEGAENALTFAPTHLGVQPAVYTNEEGEEVQPFSAIYESAFAFYDSLDDEQLAALSQGEQVQQFACQPGGTCSFDTGVGLVGADLTDEQKQLLLDVIANWVGMADDETTAAALAEIEATLDETYISWSGATVYDMTQGDGIGFLISGPNVYVGFAAQQGSAGADVDGVTTSGWGHVHTIYRDPTNDYAGSVEQQESAGMSGGPGGGQP
ncbi:DUF3500 domain-containing protein [Microbacterium sediminis]|uniref:DUF3500 domain-containing protein n=1 Tax=Microbacterium sediminis TaxID=904291 RepID=UPI0010729D5C|nr:DUF3500 domain-containing protein [Microbacterium sediminis]QBR74523.1 DUF3500 domain-containing protein [Microbacterium sediminis]